MTAIFSNVVVDLEKELKGKFHTDFDYVAMVQKLSDHAGVQMQTSQNGDSENISLHGSWFDMTQVYNLLITALTMYGATTVPKDKLEPQVMLATSESIVPVVENTVEYESDNDLNTMTNDTENHNINSTPENDTAHCLSIQPCGLNTQLDSVAAPVMKNIEHASILANGDGIIHGIAHVVLDKEICEDGIDHVDMDIEMQVTNDSDHTTIKKKQGLLVNEKNEFSTIPTSQLKCRSKSNSLPGEIYSVDIKPNMHCGRGRPRKFPVGEQFCEKCDFVGKDRQSLNAHCQRVHFGIPTKCDVCHKIFPNRRYMKSHKASHNIRQHCCDVCGKIYKIRKAMLEHKKTHEEDYVKPSFYCDLCPKSYSTQYSLTTHTKSEHFGEKKKTHLCSICGKSFTTKTTLQEHSNAHTGVKTHVCEVCGKGFSYGSSLREHKSVHVDKQFACGICKKVFRQRTGLQMHMRIHEQVKQYVCNACGLEFTQRHSLLRHERVHKGERPFICKLCSRNFSDTSIIRRHLILVHKIHKDAKTWREDIISMVQDASCNMSFLISQNKQNPRDDHKEEGSDSLLMDVKSDV